MHSPVNTPTPRDRHTSQDGRQRHSWESVVADYYWVVIGIQIVAQVIGITSILLESNTLTDIIIDILVVVLPILVMMWSLLLLVAREWRKCIYLLAASFMLYLLMIIVVVAGIALSPLPVQD